MKLEKTKSVRKVEVMFTDDKVHDICHCVYDIEIKEDGKEISRSTHRENISIDEFKTKLIQADKYTQT